MADKLPHGAVSDAADGICGAFLFDHGQARRFADAALTAAMPGIRRAVLREAARQILALDAEDRSRHHVAAKNVGPWNDMGTVLRKLLRGEPIPALPDHKPEET